MHFRSVTVLIGLVMAFIIFSCKRKTEAAQDQELPDIRTLVTVTAPVAGNFSDDIQMNGNTQFLKKTVVRANITGYITNMHWKQGDRITNGNIFCNIKTKEQEALKNIDAAEPSLSQFQTAIKVLTGSSGIITSVGYANGDFVTEGDVLATITDPFSLVLVFNVPYEYHDFVYKGKGCTVILPDGKIIAATVQEEIPFVDSVSQTQRFLIRFPGNLLLPENMNLIVRIPLKQSTQSLSLPLDAIQTDETQEKFWVMKIINDSLAVRTAITVGLQHDSIREVFTGLGLHDKVILKGAYGMPDSAKIIIAK